jgi:threonyl-tRNA synthetase
MGTLLEHYAGALPLWLSPVQVAVIPVAEAHEAYAAKVEGTLGAAGFRVELMRAEETLGARIRSAQNQKMPYMIVLGDKEVQAGKIAVRSRKKGDEGQTDLAGFAARLGEERDKRMV